MIRRMLWRNYVWLVCTLLVIGWRLGIRWRKSRFRKKNGVWTWVSYTPAGTSEASLGVDLATFEILENRKYARDSSRVFYKWNCLPDADPSTFRFLPFGVGGWGQVYARDSAQVFLRERPVLGADPESFELIKGIYCRDKCHVFCGTVPIPGADRELFEVIRDHESVSTIIESEIMVELNGEVFRDLPISGQAPATTSYHSWARDAHSHYRGAAPVLDADYETYRATDGWEGEDRYGKFLGPFRVNCFGCSPGFQKMPFELSHRLEALCHGSRNE